MLGDEGGGVKHIGCFEMRTSVGGLCFARDGRNGNLSSHNYPMSCVS
jgi:hypothetical protein